MKGATRRRLATSTLGGVAIVGLATIIWVGAGVGPALAANEAHVRTPVSWPAECGRVVDRSVDPITRFAYTIPNEDAATGADELPDSRTHQFIAVCRQHPLTELLPAWITRDDVDRSVALGLLEADAVTYREILDETTLWSGCFTRITDDDDRRPISFEQAAAGVEWDTSAVDRGVWSIAGYTFEPTLNLWRDRPGFVKILDDPSDPEQDLPALGLLAHEQVVEPGAAIVLEACVDAYGPAELTIEWAPFAPSLVWQPLGRVSVDRDGALDLDVVAPTEAADSQILIRARVVDALGREYVAHAPARVSVLPCVDGCVDPDTPAPADAGCSVCPAPPTGLWLALLIMIAWVRSPKPDAAVLGHARAQHRDVVL